MMKNKTDIVKLALDGFQSSKGRAAFFCSKTETCYDIIIQTIIKCSIHAKDKLTVGIITNTYKDRKNILEIVNSRVFSEHPELEEKLIIRAYSEGYVNTSFHLYGRLCITFGVNSNYEIIEHFSKDVKFMMSIITSNMTSEFINSIKKTLTWIDLPNAALLSNHERCTKPVKIEVVPVELNNEDSELYEKHTTYINETVMILGDFENIEKCRIGIPKEGISANQYRLKIANNNGWTSDIDTSIAFMADIDRLYNPNNIKERAVITYNVIHERRKLVSDNKAKLDKIIELIQNHPTERILIVCYHSSFASFVTDSINSKFGDICTQWHDAIPASYIYDENGKPICNKSGENKGKPKIFKSQKLSSNNMKLYNEKKRRIMCINHVANNRLDIETDITIIVSPYCENIVKLRERFDKVLFTGNCHQSYLLYCNSTNEEDKLQKLPTQNFVTIINDSNNDIIYQ